MSTRTYLTTPAFTMVQAGGLLLAGIGIGLSISITFWGLIVGPIIGVVGLAIFHFSHVPQEQVDEPSQ